MTRLENPVSKESRNTCAGKYLLTYVEISNAHLSVLAQGLFHIRRREIRGTVLIKMYGQHVRCSNPKVSN